MHNGHRLSLKAQGMELEATSRAPAAAPGQVFTASKQEMQDPRKEPFPSPCPQKGRLENKHKGQGVRCL